MGTGASKNQRSAFVSNCQQPTRLLNNRAQIRRASRRESEEPEYVLLPGIKNEKFYSNLHTPLNLELLGDVPTASSTAPGLNSNAILDGIPAKDRAGIDTSSSESTSSISSTKERHGGAGRSPDRTGSGVGGTLLREQQARRRCAPYCRDRFP